MDGGQWKSVCKLYFVLRDLVGEDIGQMGRGVLISHGGTLNFLLVANFVCVGVLPEEVKNQVGYKKGECNLELKACLRLSNR